MPAISRTRPRVMARLQKPAKFQEQMCRENEMASDVGEVCLGQLFVPQAQLDLQ